MSCEGLSKLIVLGIDSFRVVLEWLNIFLMSFENRDRQDQKFMSGIPIISRYLSKNQIRYLASGSKVFKIKLVWSFRTHIEHMLWVSIGRKVQTPLLGSHESTALERPTKYPHISNISTSAHFQNFIGFTSL